MEKMTNSKTRRALLTSALAILACVAMLMGTTFAWFTDAASTGVNKIVSGNLDVALEMKNSDGEWVSAEGKTLNFVKAAGGENEQLLWEPGCRYKLPELRVVNKGSLALKYKLLITGIAGDAELNDVIEWTISVNREPTSSLDSIVDRILEPGCDSGSIVLAGHMLETAGNHYQNMTIDGIGVTVYATQAVSEHDSFGNDYDELAEYGTPVATQQEFLDAVAAGKDVLLAGDIALDSELKIDKDITIYGNGHAVVAGAPVRVASGSNVTFKNVWFDAPENGRGNASNLYAAYLEGTLMLDGCVFTNTQWDSIQVIPLPSASIVINGCKFVQTSGTAQRFIHIEAAQNSNADVKITLTNNFFGSSANIANALIDLDYINLDGIDFGGNNIYTDTNKDIYVCGAGFERTIEKDAAYKALGALKAADDAVLPVIEGNTAIAACSSATIDSATSIGAGTTIAGDSKDDSVLKTENAKISADDVTIKDITIKGSGSIGVGGTLNINGNNTSLENVNYEGDGNIAIAVSTGKNNTGTVFKKTKITKAFRGIQFWSLSGDSVIDECVLDVAGYTFNIDAAVAGSTLSIRNSTLNGWTSYTSGIKLVSFESCQLGLNAYEYLRPYSETKLTNCAFTSVDYQLNAGGADAYTITLTDCTKNGVAITAENVQDLLLDTSTWNTNATLIVNGVTVTL